MRKIPRRHGHGQFLTPHIDPEKGHLKAGKRVFDPRKTLAHTSLPQIFEISWAKVFWGSFQLPETSQPNEPNKAWPDGWQDLPFIDWWQGQAHEAG